MKLTKEKLKDLALFVPDIVYSVVCGKLECTYCTFYRGVALGLVIGTLVGAEVL